MGILQHAKPPKSNLSKEERMALKSLMDNKDIIILPADKGKSVVIMDKEEYESQCEKLLSDEKTYKNIGDVNPTKTLKGKIQRKLRAMKKDGHIDEVTYRNTPRQMLHQDPMPPQRYISSR